MLIVCEGEKTEPLYFNFLRSKLGLTATVEVSGESDSAPSKVVNFGKKKIKLDPDYEYVFFVFDKDSHADYDTALSWIRDMKSQRNYKNFSISAITSNPCFELWLLLHLRQFATPCAAGGGNSACENLKSVLRQQPGFEDYKKGEQKHFKLLYERVTCSEETLRSTVSTMPKLRRIQTSWESLYIRTRIGWIPRKISERTAKTLIFILKK